MSRISSMTRGIVGALVITGAVLALPRAAEAGCLIEYDTCASCAQQTMRQAMEDYDLLGIRRANLELWDCAIDLSHCVFLAAHHDYVCAL